MEKPHRLNLSLTQNRYWRVLNLCVSIHTERLDKIIELSIQKFYLNEKNRAIIAMTTANPTPIPKIILLPSTFTKILDHIEIKF